jgi:hypothetical protein
VIATAAVNQIPYPWVAQTRPGGRVLLPWADTYTGGLLALTVNDDGTAQGGIVAESNFMWLREQREARGAVKPTASKVGSDPDRTDASITTCHPHNVTGPHGARLAMPTKTNSPYCSLDPAGSGMRSKPLTTGGSMQATPTPIAGSSPSPPPGSEYS